MATNTDHTAFCQRWNKIIDGNQLCLLQNYTEGDMNWTSVAGPVTGCSWLCICDYVTWYYNACLARSLSLAGCDGANSHVEHVWQEASVACDSEPAWNEGPWSNNWKQPCEFGSRFFVSQASDATRALANVI